MLDEDFVQEISTCRLLKRKMYSFVKSITVEPTMFLYMMAFMTTNVVERELFFQKACRVDYGLSEKQCLNLTDELGNEIQATVSTFNMWNDIAGHLVPIVLALFMGNWSDRRGRKIPLLLGLFSKFIYSGMMVVNALQPTWNLNMIIYTATLPQSILGADVAIFAACFSYISDVSSSEQRTVRVTILDVIYLSTMPIGVQLGSYLFNNVVNKSYALMFSINASLLFLAIIYSLIRLEIRTSSNQEPLNEKNIFIDFFDKNHLIETYRTVTKKRPGFVRLHIWLVLFSMLFYVFQREENFYMFYYTKKMFGWDVTSYSHFKTFRSLFFIIAMLFGIPLLSKVFAIKDTFIILVGATSHACARIVYFFALSPTVLYSGTVVAALGPTVAPVLRSMISKLVTSRERGKLFSLLSVFDNAAKPLITVIYSQLYNYYLNKTPGAVFWLTFVAQLIVFTLATIIICTTRINQTENYQPADNIQNEDKKCEESQEVH